MTWEGPSRLQTDGHYSEAVRTDDGGACAGAQSTRARSSTAAVAAAAVAAALILLGSAAVLHHLGRRERVRKSTHWGWWGRERRLTHATRLF
jgi:hypothetical protein